jgi:uncharacterized protein
MLPIDEYEKLRRRPVGRPVMHQSWHDLLFLHFSVEPEVVQRLLPGGLQVDTFPKNGEQRAWIGLVPFRMSGIRPHGMPAAPWLSAFPETNVRTYVHQEGREPGVWFFSLDAARWIACQIARATFSLPYYHSVMSVTREADRISYRSRRYNRSSGQPTLGIEARIGESAGTAEPGTLEFFLVERYLLYSLRGGQLWKGQVHHVPYPLRAAELQTCDQSLVGACGIDCNEWEHVLFSDGVDVEVFGIQRT